MFCRDCSCHCVTCAKIGGVKYKSLHLLYGVARACARWRWPRKERLSGDYSVSQFARTSERASIDDDFAAKYEGRGTRYENSLLYKNTEKKFARGHVVQRLMTSEEKTRYACRSFFRQADVARDINRQIFQSFSRTPLIVPKLFSSELNYNASWSESLAGVSFSRIKNRDAYLSLFFRAFVRDAPKWIIT